VTKTGKTVQEGSIVTYARANLRPDYDYSNPKRSIKVLNFKQPFRVDEVQLILKDDQN
jgi:hypothetical protein